MFFMKTLIGMHKRSVFCFFLLLFLFFVTIVRLLTLTSDTGLAQTATTQNSKSVEVYLPRGTFYDTNGLPLTNQYSRVAAVFAPTPQGIFSAATLLQGQEKDRVLHLLQNGNPAVATVQEAPDLPGVTYMTVPVRYAENQPAAHTIGYLDSTGQGVAGLERGLNDLLSTDTPMRVSYAIDALGNVLEGVTPTVRSGGSVNDVKLTIDARIQQIAQRSLQNISKGAVVVLQAGTGKIRAMVSNPQIQPANLQAYIHGPDSPFVHRALSAYNVGSVFKTCVAAAALDNGYDITLPYTCSGSMTLGGRAFRCHNAAGHGKLTLPTAIAYSCNTYFYNLGLQIGYNAILQMANRFGFGRDISIGGGLVCRGGNLPLAEELVALPGAVANLSIGQGALTLSPLALASMYEAVVCDGVYMLPSIIEGVYSQGVYTPHNASVKAVGMQASTAQQIKAYLIQALDEGIGSAAKPLVGVAGGKTATAQTGQIINGVESVHGWFCGFVTHNGQTYVIVVFAEDAASGSGACTPIFKEIAEGLAEI